MFGSPSAAWVRWFAYSALIVLLVLTVVAAVVSVPVPQTRPVEVLHHGTLVSAHWFEGHSTYSEYHGSGWELGFVGGYVCRVRERLGPPGYQVGQAYTVWCYQGAKVVHVR